LHTLVYEIIRDFGFSPRQVEEVVKLLDSGSGKYLLSPTHRILKNRNWLILSSHRAGSAGHILIETAEEKVVYEGGVLILGRVSAQHAESLHRNAPKQPGRNASDGTQSPVALLDAAGIRFPLLLRKWRQGDYFYPLGMRKKKKLGRFLIDNKLSLIEKEKVWVIEMDKKIIWVLGLRIDDRFRVTPQTREILKIELGMA
jgi:tRNA(Ile)-lysidine synthase